MTVDDQVVDVIMARALQTGVDTLPHMLSREATLVGTTPHGHGNFCGEHILVSRQQFL